MKFLKPIALSMAMLCLLSMQGRADTVNIDIGSDWNTARNASFDVTSGLSLGANGYAFADISDKLTKNTLYVVKANTEIKGSGHAIFGFAFYDSHQKLLKTVKTLIKKDDLHLEFSIPAYAAHTLIFTKTDPGFNGQVKVKTITLSQSPMRDRSPE